MTTTPHVVRVVLPAHLRSLAKHEGEVQLEVLGTVCVRSVLDALELKFPVLRGTIRTHDTQVRRPFVRFYACERDYSHDPVDGPLPSEVGDGKEPFLVVGAMSGG
ncbi:MAG: MoaD/ThiS family protein [Actinomycetes bacterium]